MSSRPPEPWLDVRLGEAAEIEMGQSPPGHTYNEDGKGLPLINGPVEFGRRFPTKIQWTTAPSKTCYDGDVLFCVRGSTTGRMNVSKPDEQLQIPDFLERQEDRTSAELGYLLKVQTIKTGLMQDLLTGKVRVKVDEEETQDG